MACSEVGWAHRTGAMALAEALLGHARRPTVFLVTGNQNLPLVDALGRNGVRLVHARHEAGAGYMAEGWGRSSGEPGIALVTAGPGLTSALTPLASAMLAEAPMILLSASHPLSEDGCGAFQELRQTQLTSPLCKAAARCEDASRLGRLFAWAWQEAAAFPPGPVHLELPADVLTRPCPAHGGPAATAPAGQELPAERGGGAPAGGSPAAGRPGAGDAGRLAHALRGASHPLVLLRPSLGRDPAAARLGLHVPVLTVESPRGLRDPAWADDQGLIAAADHVAVLGPADYAVGFGRIGSAQVHVQPGADPAFLGELASLLEGLRSARRPAAPRQAQRTSGASAAPPGPMRPADVAAVAGDLLSPDDVLVVDGGEFCQWMRHGLRHLPNRQLVNGKLGAIGGSTPMAIGAAAHAPHRRHVVFIGDGSFGYYCAEIDTAVREGLPITVVVGVDGCWGSEWHQQRRRHGGRTYATEIGEPRYDLVAEGFGASGRLVENAAGLREALARALAGRGVTCVGVRIRREASPAA